MLGRMPLGDLTDFMIEDLLIDRFEVDPVDRHALTDAFKDDPAKIRIIFRINQIGIGQCPAVPVLELEIDRKAKWTF